MSHHFESLFGIKPGMIQTVCIIMPFNIPRAGRLLGVSTMIEGRIFACGQGDGFTLIRSGMSAGFVGDCALYLEETPCQKVLFLGTCGLIHRQLDLDIGSLVTPVTIHAFESFSAIVTNTLTIQAPLHVDSIFPRELKIPCVNAVSFASLHEEEKHLALFDKIRAVAIEMECHAFFLACRNINRTAGALLVISDILQEKTFSSALAPDDKKKLADGINRACGYLKSIISQ
ncbi:MAG: hypothetical protein WCI27_08640 [Candidatus Omnitrophota bacterium]